MGEWREYELGEAPFEIIDGDRGKNYPKKNEYFENGYCLFLNTKNVTNNGFAFTELNFITKEKDGLLKKGRLKRYDLVLTTRGTVGNVGFYNANITFDNIRINSGMVIIRPNGIDEKFNYQLFKYLKKDFEIFATGSAQPQLPIRDLKKMTFLLPPLPEQKAIAAVLSSLDDKIDLLHRQNKTLEAMAETLFRQWFVEETQEDWEEEKLGDFINVKHGYAFKGKSITTERNDQILVTPGNFKIGGGFKFGKMKYFIGLEYPNEYIFSSDDLIVTMTDLSKEGATLGYSALIPEHNKNEVLYLHNQRVGKIEFKKDISKYFIYYLMKTDDYQWFILGGASGTSVRHTSPTSICNYPFQVPPMKRVKEFDKIVNELISKIYKNQKQIRTLEKLRDTLLPKLMSSKVKVKT